MMRAVTNVTRPYNIPTTVSLNTIMVDGTGMCGGCRVQVGDKTLFTCVDGPEFDGHLVDFDSVLKRNNAYRDDDDCRLEAQIADLDVSELLEEVVVHQKQRQEMPELPADSRIRNFDEVALGFTEEQALAEANRCLHCKRAFCVEGCPVSVNIPEFIALIKEGKYVEAGLKIKEDNSLPPRVCGRVCPQSDQCEGSCILGRRGQPIAIGSLERFASDILAEAQLEVTAPNSERKTSKSRYDRLRSCQPQLCG